MEYLCKCNKCDSVLIDENPQTGAIQLEAPANVRRMIQVEAEQDDPDENREVFWACPECKTDYYLSDLPIN